MTNPRLSLPSRLMSLQYKLYDRMRHRRAFEVAREPGTAPGFSGFGAIRQCLLVTFKRSGEPVPTPVNFGRSGDGNLYFRSEPHVAKVRRLRHDGRVRVYPCNFRGKPRGPGVEARARVLPDSAADHAYSVIESNWSVGTKLIERVFDRIDVPMVYVEVVPAAATEAEGREPDS